MFTLVDELVKNHEFDNLKGLIYFTDGYGTFPAKKPDYDAAFLFIDEENNSPDVPPWAIKLVLRKDEIKNNRFGGENIYENKKRTNQKGSSI